MNDLFHRNSPVGVARNAARWMLAIVVLVHWLATGPGPLPFSPDGSPAAPLAQVDRTSHAIASRNTAPVIVKQTARETDVTPNDGGPHTGLFTAGIAAIVFGNRPLVAANPSGRASSAGLSPYQARAPPIG